MCNLGIDLSAIARTSYAVSTSPTAKASPISLGMGNVTDVIHSFPLQQLDGPDVLFSTDRLYQLWQCLSTTNQSSKKYHPLVISFELVTLPSLSLVTSYDRKSNTESNVTVSRKPANIYLDSRQATCWRMLSLIFCPEEEWKIVCLALNKPGPKNTH